MHSASDQPRILMGGTGRCGTSILARLFESHPDIMYFSEPHIWMRGCGVLELVCGRVTPDQCEQVLLTYHIPRMIEKLTEHGHEGAEQVYSARYVSATFRWAFSQPGSRLERAGRFVDGLFALGIKRWGGRTWAEKTPKTVMHVDLLGRMFPQMRYFHILREPKDVFCSVRHKHWGPNTVTEFVRHYYGLMNQAWQAQLVVPDRSYMTLTLDQLVRDPRRTAQAALAFAGLEQPEDLVEQFAAKVSAGHSHSGRWREELSGDEVRMIDEKCASLYQRWLRKAQKDSHLRGFGLPCGEALQRTA